MSDTPKGWECPQCGKVNAPWVPHCIHNPYMPPCDHQWIEDTAGTRCWKCGLLVNHHDGGTR